MGFFSRKAMEIKKKLLPRKESAKSEICFYSILYEGATKPTRATSGAAGLDIYASLPQPVIIEPGCRQLVGSGVSIALPNEHFGLIKSRSGLATRLSVDVEAGVVDCDYRGEVRVLVANNGETSFKISAGDRIAQLVVLKYECPTLILTRALAETTRGENGFGSTGIR